MIVEGGRGPHRCGSDRWKEESGQQRPRMLEPTISTGSSRENRTISRSSFWNVATSASVGHDVICAEITKWDVHPAGRRGGYGRGGGERGEEENRVMVRPSAIVVKILWGKPAELVGGGGWRSQDDERLHVKGKQGRVEGWHCTAYFQDVLDG